MAIGPDYARRLHMTVTADALKMRTTLSLPGILWAWILCALASPFAAFFLAFHPLSPGLSEDVSAMLGLGITVLGGPLLYLLIALLLRREIVLDRERSLLLVRHRAIAPLSEVDHIEKAAGQFSWSRLAIVLKSGRKIFFLNAPTSHSSADTVAETVARFLAAPYKDYSEGNYTEILRLRVEGERLAMHPPNQLLAQGIGWGVGILFAGLCCYFMWVVFPRQTGHQFQGARGVGYIIFAVAYGAYYLATRLFHRRIVLDRRHNRLSIGLWKRIALSDIVHIGFHIKQKSGYRMAFVLAGDRQVPILSYRSRFAKIGEAARRIAHFLSVPIVDYHAQNL